MKYTVILMRPDYATDNYGTDTFMTHVEAVDPRTALSEARALVIDADFGEDAAEVEPADYACIALIEGEHKDLNPEP